MNIRGAQHSDIPAILDFLWQLDVLDGQEKDFHVDESSLAELLFSERPVGEAWVAADAEPAGVAIVSPILFASDGRASLYLTKLFVKEEYRGQGIGRSLIRHCQQVARARNLARVVWGANATNESAFRFYEGLGAEEITGARWYSLDAHEHC